MCVLSHSDPPEDVGVYKIDMTSEEIDQIIPKKIVPPSWKPLPNCTERVLSIWKEPSATRIQVFVDYPLSSTLYLAFMMIVDPNHALPSHLHALWSVRALLPRGSSHFLGCSGIRRRSNHPLQPPIRYFVAPNDPHSPSICAVRPRLQDL